MEKWNEICCSVNRHKKSNSDEKSFQSEIESILVNLGWSRYKNEIISTPKIPIGSVNTIIPDIIIKHEFKNAFVIELKHPNFSLTQNHENQLISYMRQLKLDFGILIDKSLHLYYDEPTNDDKPIKIFETEFIENNEDALELIFLLEKQNFDKNKLKIYCEQKLEMQKDKKIADEIINDLVKNGEKKIIELLIENLRFNYNENIIKYVIANLYISAKRKGENIKNPIIEGTKTQLKNNKHLHEMNLSPINNKITKDNMKIGEFIQYNMKKLFEDRILSQNEINLLQDKDYSKKVFDQNFEVLKSIDKEITDMKGRKRYYSKEKFFGNYYLCSQWVERHWKPFTDWLERMYQNQ